VLTLGLGLILLLVSIPLPLRLAEEVVELGKGIATMDVTQLLEWIRSIPMVGELSAHQLTYLQNQEGGLAAFISSHQATLLTFATQVVKGIIDTLTIVFMSLVGCFILYLHGENLVVQSRSIVAKLGASRADRIFDYIGLTIRGAAYSVIATAIAQGTLAGIGYAFVGAPLPLLLAMVTMILALIPFGAPLLYVPVAAYLVFFTDLPWYYGVGLLIWGIVCVSTVDNFLRSILISQATQVSAIIVFAGVVGGVLAFGLLGVFVGPALIGVAQTLWIEFAEE
jgi:predicted PurR-regulated permease PerM